MAEADRSVLESFDGSDPAVYRKWRRRAQVMLAALPTTVPKEKLGARLMQHIKGEAELVCEAIPVDKLCAEGGEAAILKLLDEKYGPQPKDLLHRALKEFFYELYIKPHETYQQFLARFFHASQQLKEQEIDLPPKVLGFMLIKKLKLETQQESMLLTATGGDMALEKVTASVKDIFPEGKGGTVKSKEIFLAQEDGEDEVQEAMEAIADDIQGQDHFEDEEVLDAYETYAEVRRKMLEKRKARGFTTVEPPRWKLSGSVTGKLEQLKSRTRCHLCKRQGHWKRECPLAARQGGSRTSRTASSSGTASASQKGSEAHYIENDQGDDVYFADQLETIEMLKKFEAKPIRWGEGQANDVRNAGFADTHSTGNRQRETSSATVVHVKPSSPTLEDSPEEVLSADTASSVAGFDPTLAQCGVPDTACRRTLVGAYTLECIATRLRSQGLRVLRSPCRNSFRFGNDGTLVSEEVAVLPARVGSRVFFIKAAVLGGQGRSTPLLLSKDLLKRLGAVIDMNKDEVWFALLGERVELGETRRGHYGVQLFEGIREILDKTGQQPQEISQECLVSQAETRKIDFDIDKLEEESHASPEAIQDQELCAPPPSSQKDGTQGDSREGAREPEAGGCRIATHDCRGACGGAEGVRWPPRSERGRGIDRSEHERVPGHAGRKVSRAPAERHLPRRQIVHPMGEDAGQEPGHGQDEQRSASVQSLRRLQGCGQVQSDCRELAEGGQGQAIDDIRAVQCHSVPSSQGCQRSVPSEASYDAQSKEGRCGPNGSGGGQHTLASGGESRDGSAMAGHGEQQDGDVGAQEEDSPQPYHQECGACSPGRGELDGNLVKLGRKARRQLRKSLIAAVDECMLVQEDRWIPEESCCNNFVHVCMSDEAVKESPDVAEVFSLPRLIPRAEQKGLKGLKSYDIGNGWDFLKASHRKQCLKDIRERRPMFVMVSPPCGPFSAWQRLNRRHGKPTHEELIAAQVLCDFAVQVCMLQCELGNLFALEHPVGASSWKTPSWMKLADMSGVSDVTFDQCMYGLREPESERRYQKTTRIRTNCRHVLEKMGRRCDGKHSHQKLEGQVRVGGQWCRRTSLAQVYPRQFVDTIVSCVRLAGREREHEVLSSEKLQETDQKKLLESVRRCHVNLGHPSRERFLHMLRSAGASANALQLAKGLKCSVCDTKKQPPSHPVAKHRRAQSFNEQINLDTFELPIYQGRKLHMLNVFDESTGYQICIPLWRGKTAEGVRKAYRKSWKRWAGCPIRVLTDNGAEFDAEAQQGFELDGSYVEKIAAYAPWQNGAAERHGGVWKTVFAKAFEETQPGNKKEVNELVDHVNQAKNSMSRKHGYAPYQHIFGCDLRLPGSVSDPLGVVHNSALVHGVQAVLRSQEIRQAARKAFVATDDDEKVRRALEHRSRPQRGPFSNGDFVYYWRRYAGDGVGGRWRGPGIIIGRVDTSKIWVAVGNKVLKCAPEQLRRATEDQEAALRMVTPDLIGRRRENRGAQVFLDISNEGSPDEGDPGPEAEDRKRTREQAGLDEGNIEPSGHEGQQAAAGVWTDSDIEQFTDVPEQGASEIPDTIVSSRRVSNVEMPAENDSKNAVTVQAHSELPGPGQHGYGPMRNERAAGVNRHQEYQPTELERALQRGVEMLDVGNTRLPRTWEPKDVPVAPNDEEDLDLLNDDDDEVLEAFLLEKGVPWEVYLAQKNRAEISWKNMSKDQRIQADRGMRKEWDKLLRTTSIKLHEGEAAEALWRTVPPENILESRFVHTERESPEVHGQTEVKSRWCIKGFKDPAILSLEKQSPTLTADGLSTVLQLIASMKWRLTVADIEGAFLQGHGMNRPGGKVYVRLPKEGVPGVEANTLVEVCKYVYGLADAPRQWSLCLSEELRKLGLRQSQLDPCCFYWYHDNALSGVIAFHVDDLVIGGSTVFAEKVLKALRERFPFKHWVEGQAKFLGRRLRQLEDFSIVCDQEEYASQVRSVYIGRERRREKDEPLTSKELTQLRGVLGAANWLVGSTRPDIATANAMLQRRVARATVADLIEANRLVALIRDHASMTVTFKSIDLRSAAFLLATDASWSNNPDLRSQAGHMILFADNKLEREEWASVSPMRWRSFKLDRHTQSTLASELMSLARGIAEGNWMRSLLAEAVFE